MKIWQLNLYEKYLNFTKNGIKLWECRRDNHNYKINDQIEFINKSNGEKLLCEIIDIFKTNDIYTDTNLVILSLKNII